MVRENKNLSAEKGNIIFQDLQLWESQTYFPCIARFQRTLLKSFQYFTLIYINLTSYYIIFTIS